MDLGPERRLTTPAYLNAQSVFKVRGFQISGDEFGVLLRSHPDVDEDYVLGIPDPYSGELPVAFVVLGDKVRPVTNRWPRCTKS